jgi:serine/threonine protein kinase
MWQPRTYSWVLIDFGLVARIKESAPVGCTPGYAAPETALALLQGHKQMIVDEKVDSWALGVIAYELLMERSAFGVFQGVTDVRSEPLDFKQVFSAIFCGSACCSLSALRVLCAQGDFSEVQ